MEFSRWLVRVLDLFSAVLAACCSVPPFRFFLYVLVFLAAVLTFLRLSRAARRV